MSRVGITLLCLAVLAAPALADSATGLCEFYGAQPLAGRILLKASGWSCLRNGTRWIGSNPCRWGAKSGIICDGGVTVSSIVRFCEAKGGPLRGPLTAGLTRYISLSTLVLSGCGLTGTIPTAFSAENAFPSLRQLDLSKNRISGLLPILMGQSGSMDSMYALDLSSNLFFGILPGQWAKDGYFPNLKLLALNNNPMLIGIVPPVWGKVISSRPDAIKVNLCNTRVRGPLAPTMDGGSVQIFGQLSPKKMCGKLPATFAGPGYQAGIYACPSWPLAIPAKKYKQAQMPACAV